MLRPGGSFVLVDKNVLCDERPSALAPRRGGEVARPAERASGCIRHRRPGPRALVPAGRDAATARAMVRRSPGRCTCSRETRRAGSRSGQFPPTRLFVALGGADAGRSRMNATLLADPGLAAAAPLAARPPGWS